MRSLALLARSANLPSYIRVAPNFHARPGSFAYQVRSISSRRRRLAQFGPTLQERLEAPISAQHPNETARSQDALDLYDHLERFLPLKLRQRTTAINKAQPDIEISYAQLPTFMRQFRQISAPGALSYLASADDRLEAFAFLAKQLLKLDAESRRTNHALSDMLALSPWLQEIHRAQSLDLLTEEPLVFNQTDGNFPPALKLEDTIDKEDVSKPHRPSTAYREAIGELWAALGEIVIRASGLSEQAAQRLMQHAHLVFAQMHSKGLVPSESYSFDDSTTPKAFRKPPYLHILGSRMMAAMSDASWSLSASEEPLTPGVADAEFPPVAVEDESSTPYHLRPNVWLEFVLWNCVHQGYYIEASRLLSAVCLAAEDSRWKTLTWDQVLSMQPNAHRRQQSWFDRLMSITEGYSAERPLIEMPAKTLSCEVVVAIIEGLLSSGDIEQVHSARRVSFYAYCQSLQDRDEAQALMLKSMIHRLEDSLDLEPRVIAQLLFQQTKYAASKYTQKRYTAGPPAAEDKLRISTAFADMETSPFLTHTLAAWEFMILNGEVSGALELFDTVRNVPQLLPSPPVLGHQTSKRRGLTSDDASSAAVGIVGSLSSSGITSPRAPKSLLAPFLRLLVRTNNLENVRLLLYGENFGLRDNATDNTFQPALLQAAVAVGDKELLSTIVQRLDIGLHAQPDDFLYALCEAHVWLGIFDHTRVLLRHMAKQRGLPLKPGLIVAIACKYIAAVDSKRLNDAEQLRKILKNILDGRYVIPRNPSQLMDYTESRWITQLSRILRTAHPSIEQMELRYDEYGQIQANTPIAVSPDAFNPILATVAEIRGFDAARKFFDTWCQPLPAPTLPDTQAGVPVVPAPFQDEKVVTPTLETVQTLLRSPLEDLRVWSHGGTQRTDPGRYILKWMENTPVKASRDRPTIIELPSQAPHQKLFEWAAHTLRKMGYDDHAINCVIPGTFPHAK